MQKITSAYLISAMTVLVLAVPLVAQAQAVPATDTKTPQRMTFTVDYVNAPIPVFLKASGQVPEGQNHDALLLAALLKGGAQKTEVQITTVDGVMARGDTKQDVPMTDAASGQHNYFTMDNFVEAMPHINSYGTINVTFKTQGATIIPDVTPMALRVNTLSGAGTFQDSQASVVSSDVLGPTDKSRTTHLIFMTVTTLAH